jgi:glycosyltransferase involved in cell wall biosynthesis
VVYAHFLVPSGLLAAVAGKAPLVVTAHGRDVRNVGAIRGVATATRATVRHAAAVIAVSDYLRRELEAKVPGAIGKTEVVDSGVDLERFSVEPAPPDGPRFLCIGSLTERKNVLRLADAFARLGEGSLTFVGDGPLRGRLEGRERVELAGVVPHDELAARIAAAHVVCQPSLIEPFGQATLEAMACGRSVVATRTGGPPEFVPPEAGLLVDPLDVEALTDALRAAAAMACPNPAARRAAEPHDVRKQAERVEAILQRAAAERG